MTFQGKVNALGQDINKILHRLKSTGMKEILPTPAATTEYEECSSKLDQCFVSDEGSRMSSV